MDRLHPVLGPWLRGQCLAQSLLLAAGHPQRDAQRAEAVSCLVPLVQALQLPDLRVVNSYAHICHALSSLVLQQPQPLERMKLFSTTTPGRGGSCVESCTKCLEVATALLSREEWCVVALSGSMCCPLPDLALTKSTWQFDWMDGLQPLLPPALPVLHRAVTAATGSAVLLRLTLWLTHHQPPQAALAAAVTACARQLSHIARIGTQALPSLSLAQRGGPEGVVLRRLAIQATAAAAHAQITLTQLVYPGLVKGVVPGVAWPLHPVLSLLETVREEWSLMSCIRSSCDNTFLEEAESEWPSKLVAGGHVELLCATEQLIQHAPMQPDTEQALDLLVLTLAIAVPLVTVLKLSEGATCPKVALQLQELRRSLGLVPAQEVQGVG
ncbi:hypothetical protein HaLaN_02650 [Haematococcus lacustris]|uniref:Uncharacterized protein n=1 Tax=Haematococcus lacustris TaxID=44745 RepID=A0A699YEM2_HAELA|nr:hypothetical protein HaLaN_02650 [Haematococcus lacustris]